MKVVHITLRFDAPGGVETNVREIARRLKSGGVDVEVFASDLVDEAGWVRRSDFAATVDGVPVRRFPVRKRLVPRLTLPLMVGLVDALADSGADLFHAHSHRYGHVLETALVARRLGIPLVVSTHYHPADRREPPLKKGLLRVQDVGFGATAYRVARTLVVESAMEERLVGEFAPRDRIRIVPPGIDVAEWSDPAGDRPDGLALPDDYLLFVGRIAPNKGLPFLLDALARLPAPSRPPLVLMGTDWGEKPELERRADRLGIADRLRWIGHVDGRSRYRAVIRHARALVLPSEWEAYGLVLLEAMAAGTPIVASSVGAIPEVLDGGRAGRLVEYGNVPALAEALRGLFDDPSETRRRADRGREKATTLDWSTSAARLRTIYDEALRR